MRGPSITPGYWRRPDLNESAFDEENYYRMGDAVKLVDPADPQKGFLFDGRLNEDFKLSSGTWVRTSMLRMRLLAHFNGLLQDAVVTAPDRDYVAALLFPALDSCRKLCSDPERVNLSFGHTFTSRSSIGLPGTSPFIRVAKYRDFHLHTTGPSPGLASVNGSPRNHRQGNAESSRRTEKPGCCAGSSFIRNHRQRRPMRR